jgi:hypothetical protein
MKYLLAVLAVLLLPALALAQAVPPDPDSLEQIVGFALQALTVPGAARWVVLSLVAVVAAVWLVRHLAQGRKGAFWVWAAGDEGGTVLKWIASLVVAAVTQALAGGDVVTARTVVVALGLGAVASLRTDWRRLLRSIAPVVALAPRVGAPLAGLLRALGGGTAG